MHHGYRVFLSIFANIGNTKALWQVKVNLDCGALPGLAQGALKFNVYLRPVKYALARVYLIMDFGTFQSPAQSIGCFFPDLSRAGVFVRSGRKQDLIVAETKGVYHEERELQHSGNFFLQLVKATEDVGVVLGKSPDA